MDQTLIATIALATAVLAVVLALSAHRRLAVTKRSLLVLQGRHDGKTLVDAVATYVGHVRQTREDLEALSERQEELFRSLGLSARNLGVVRYDAFEDMGGRMSFSAALLDDHGTGVVITSINGRQDARTYAKTVETGRSEHNLSKEEEMAIAEALGSKTRVRGRR